MSDNSFVNPQAAAPAPDQETTPVPGAEEVTAAGEEQPEEPKTYTQEEVDRIAQKEREKALRKARREMAQQSQPSGSANLAPPNPDDFESAEAYIEAVADFKAEQKIAQREQQQKRQEVENTYAEREEAAREKYADFQTVVYNDDLHISEAMADVIRDSEIGPEIAYHLGKNPREAERIARLSPLAQARELGKIEASLVANPAPAKKVSSTPEPIKPVGSRASNPSYDVTDPRSVSSMSPKEWIEARNRQIAKKYAQK